MSPFPEIYFLANAFSFKKKMNRQEMKTMFERRMESKEKYQKDKYRLPWKPNVIIILLKKRLRIISDQPIA